MNRIATIALLPALVLTGIACDRAATPADTGSVVAFDDVTRSAGIDFVHESGADGGWRMPEIMGAGAALFDADGDGDLDIYLTNGSKAEAAAPAVNRYYRQEADGRFVDDTSVAGLGDPGYGMGVAVADYDGDGDNDVFVTNVGIDRLYRNDGTGRFDDVTTAAGIAVDGWSTSAAFFDYDRDGWLDLYVARYVRHDEDKLCPDSAGRPNYCGPDSFDPEHDVLLRNLGNGRFEDVTTDVGLDALRGAGLGVVVADFDDDGWFDVYVANDGDANHLWHNDAGKRFTEDALLQGAALDMHGRAEAGMGVIAVDLDGDSDRDLLMTHLANETNTWYRNRGPGQGFEDASGTSDLGVATLGDTGFGIAAVDLEHDGDLDVLVANGRVSRTDPRGGSDSPAPWDLFAEPNRVFLNDGQSGFRSVAAPRFTSPVEVSRALAVGDVDGDGDLDVLVANVGTAPRLYRNVTPTSGHWLHVRAVDPRTGSDAIGSRVALTDGDRLEVRWIQPASGYLSSHDPRAHFGLGAWTPREVRVTWPDGDSEVFPIDGLDTEMRVERGTGRAAS